MKTTKTVAHLDKKTRQILSQSQNHDKFKTHMPNFPMLIKNIPDSLNAHTVSECWKYYKTHSTNLLNESLTKETEERIARNDPNDPLIGFFMAHLKPLFKTFINLVQLSEKEIGDRTSVVLRFTFNKIGSDQLSICVIPKGRWWILNVPTDKQKMGNWFGDLIKGNHFGKCIMVELYKVLHSKFLFLKDIKK